MDRRSTRSSSTRSFSSRALVAAAVVSSAGLPMSAFAQAGAGSTVPSAAGVGDVRAEDARLRFTFNGAPFGQVLDFFARETGLPVIREADVPGGTMTFISAADYSVAEAIEILNLNLALHGRLLVRRDNFLYFRTLADAARKPGRVFDASELRDADPSEYLTITMPLSNSNADRVVEQIKPLIKEPGLATAVQPQNMVILVETAAQCARIRDLVKNIDSVKPVDSQYKIFTLKYAKASQAVESLKGLVGQRILKQIIEKDGKVRQVEEIDVAGLSLQADERLNAIIAVGSAVRLQTVEELIALIDAPEGGLSGGEAELSTFQMRSVTPEQAKSQLDALFRGLPEGRKPTLIPLDAVGKLVVVAERGLLLQATALLGELDPPAAGEAPMSAQTTARVIPLEHASAGSVESIARRMLSPRQLQMLRFTPTPNGEGLLVSGPPADVETFAELVEGVDVRPEVKREVRQVTVPGSGDVRTVVNKAKELDGLGDGSDEDPVRVIVEADSRTATLVGSLKAIQRFEGRLRDAAGSVTVATTKRTYTPEVLRPSDLAQRLPRLARPMLAPEDGSAYVAPSFEAIDELDTLVIRAEPSQFAVIDQLIAQLDVETTTGQQLRVIPVRGNDPEGLLSRAVYLMSQRVATMDEKDAAASPISTEYDELSGNVIARGTPEALRLLDESLRQAQQLTPPARTTRIVDVRNVEAKSIVVPLMELLESADPVDPSRAIPDPAVKTIERTNSLLVTAEDAQHRMIVDFVRRLDTVEQGELPPLKLLQVRTADVNAVASMLTQQYNSRPPAERTAKPVQVRADAATGTLIVSAHETLFPEIKAFVEELNIERADGPARETFLFPLKVAQATDVASAMNQLYPEPPMPRDRRGNEMPWLQKTKEVSVSADASSNSLIIDAPAERRESLETLAETLDRVEVPPVAQLRTYRIERADLRAVASMLTGLARRGTLSGPAQSGKQKVDVVVEVEPKSNTLIVAGDEVTFEKVEQILADLTAVPVERGLRIVPIANADAAAVRERSLAIYDAQVEQIPGAGSVDITVDESTNSLEVVADTEAMDRYMDIIDELQRQIGPAREVRLIELRLAKAGDVIAFLEEMTSASETLRIDGGPAPVFEAIESNNSIMVAAQPAQFRIIESLIRSLDNQQSAERPPLRIIRLRSTDAGNIATILQRNYQSRPAEDRQLKPVDIQADAATNSLIVSAHPEVLPEIEQIISELNDAQAFDSEGREIRIFPLKVARAEELAKTIDAMYPEPPMPYDNRGRPLPHLRGKKEVSVRADPVTNSLIVDAPAQRLSGFEQIVQSLDKLKVDEGVELRTYKVERADLNAVATTLRQLGSGGALGATGNTPVTVSTEPGSRTVIVSGPQTIFAQVEKVISEIDGDVDRPATSLRMYPLKFAKADRLEPLMERLLVARLRESDEAPARLVDELLEVASDAASNTLIISGPDEVQEIAAQLIEALDTEAATVGRATVRIVPLTFASASEVAQTLNGAVPNMELPAGGPVSVLAAIGSNALLLTGAGADLAKVEELIEPLDKQPFDPEKPAVETFTLTHADASEIARTVESLLLDQQQMDPRLLAYRLRYSRGQYVAPPKIRVEAERRTNALIVSGPAETIALAKSMIERLDQPAESSDRTVLTFTPAKADPAVLAQTVSKIVRETFDVERRPLEITAEPSSGAVLVIGPETQANEAVRLLAEFDDRSASMPLVEMRSFALEHAEARAVSRTVQQMLADTSRWPEDLRRAERAGLNIPRPTIQADEGTNRLLVSVPGTLMAMASDLIETLDQPRGDAAVEVRVFRLTKGDASSAAAALRETLGAGISAGEPEPRISAETNSNSVVVAASSERLVRAGELIEAMDEIAAEPSEIGVRTIFLRFASAETVAPIVERVLTSESDGGQMDYWLQYNIRMARARSGQTDEEPTVRVAAERRLNAIVVSGPTPVLTLAEEVVTGLDVDPDDRPGGDGPGGGRIVKVITLTNADAGDLADSLEAVLSDDGTGGTPPTMRVDASSNSLIVSASPGQLALIEGLATQLDSATMTSSRQMRTVRLDRSRSDARTIARTLQRILREQGGIKVEVIDAADLLEKTDEKADKTRGEDSSRLDDGIGLPSGAGGGFFGRIRHAVVVSGFAAMQDGAAQPETDTSNPNGSGQDSETGGVTIAVDPETNSLVFIGSERLTGRLTELARELERQAPAEPLGVRVVKLPDSADARSVSNLINQTVRQVGRASDNNPSGFTGRVAVSPDPDAGAVIVWANDTDFETVSSLISGVSRLDRSAELTIKVYPLVNTNGRGAARSVQELFSPNPRGRQAQRVRELMLTVEGPDGSTLEGTFDPEQISVTSDPSGTALIVSAPRSAIRVIDRFVGLLDQSPMTDRMEVRRYALENADAQDLARTIQRTMDATRQGRAAGDTPRAVAVADDRTNSLLVTASADQHDEIERLVSGSDVSLELADLATAIIPLEHTTPRAVQRIVEQVIIGRDPARQDSVQISAEDSTNMLVVKADEPTLAEVRELVAQIDISESGSYPVRSIKLERADAAEVAAGLQRFFQQRGSRSGDAAIFGDRGSGTIVIAASDEDYEQIESLVDQFDAPAADRTLSFRIIPLEHASVTDIADTVQSIAFELQWERMYGRNSQNAIDARVLVETNRRTNSVLVFGEGEILDTIENVITQLDQPTSDAGTKIVKAVYVERGDLNAIARLIEDVTATPGWMFWRGPDPEQVQTEVDRERRLVLLIGDKPRVEQAEDYIAQIDAADGGEGQVVESIRLRYAEAERAANSLSRFFRDRARSLQQRTDRVAIIGSREGNLLIVSGPPEEMPVLRDLVAQIDQPEMGEDRRIEVYTLANSDVREAANTLRAMFPRRGPVEEQVIVTPQPSRGALIVSAPDRELLRIETLLNEIDSVADDAASSIVTVPLAFARAADVADSLRLALPASLSVKITPDERSNSLLLTGSDDAIAQVVKQVERLDNATVQSPVEFRRFELDHAEAFDITLILRNMLRDRPRPGGTPPANIDYSLNTNILSVTASPDEISFIEEMIEQLDVPAPTTRRTEFVNLEYARADAVREALSVFYGKDAQEARGEVERNVTIVADQTANSLLITGDESVFEDIRALLGKLDTPEYDTSRQLVVIPLVHADAASVARALNEGFQAPLEQEIRRDQARTERNNQRNARSGERDEPVGTTVLVSAEETPSVSAEPVSNALIVFASRRELERIRAIVEQLDTPEFQRLPNARLIPVGATTRPSRLAERVRQVFLQVTGRERSSRVVVVGDDDSGVLIVRADDDAFGEIESLAEALMLAGEDAVATPRVIRLGRLPASRLRGMIANIFNPMAQRRGETLTIEVDRDSNALVVAASEEMHARIETLIRELDGPVGSDNDADSDNDEIPTPGVGQGVRVFELEHTSPESMARLLGQLGLTGPQNADRPGIVGEPIRVVPMRTKRAVAVLASPIDLQSVATLIGQLDTIDLADAQTLAIVPLELAESGTVVRLLENLLRPDSGDGMTEPASALAEQVRRLKMADGVFEKSGVDIDLSVPIKLIADGSSNSVLIASTPGNVRAMEEVIELFDRLPVGDAVVVRIFPLENASAARVRQIVEDLFRRGEALSRLPGTSRQASPTTTTGQALRGEIAATIDERTNALIVAGREEAVALIEVLVDDLDSDDAERGWIETAILPLEYADAVTLADKLDEVLVRGLGRTPDAIGLQQQIGRLRLVVEHNGGDGSTSYPSDLFAPMSGLVITPEESLNALIVVGTPTNIELVSMLADQLDVELASAGNAVRVIPLEYAAADRVEGVLREVFEGRDDLASARPEDRLIITVDARTNALIVSTSPRSFAVVEKLIETLDRDEARFAVGLHVVPVPGADVSDLAPKIRRLMNERLNAQQRRGGVESPLDVFSIEPVPADDLLIVAASDENLELVKELIAALTSDGDGFAEAERVELIPIESAGGASELAEAIDELYVRRENEKRGRRSVSVVPSERQNALLVSGTDADIEAIRELVRTLDRPEAESEQQIKRIPLRAGNSLEMVRLVEELLAGRPIAGGRGGVQATKLRFYQQKLEGQIAEDGVVEATIDPAVRELVRLTPDLRTNSVLISAPPAIMILVEEIIRDLDAETSGDREIAQYRLENADAQQMALLLRDLFNLQQQGDRLVLVPRQNLETNEPGIDGLEPGGASGPGAQAAFTPVPDQRQALAITIDRRTNTLLVSGTTEYLSQVESVVTELDSIDANEREQLVYSLKNAQAAEIQTVLTDYFAGEAELRRSVLGPGLTGSLARQLEQEVTVIGDPQANKVLVSASPRYIDTVKKIIGELDASPPQVMIQVLLAEVTLDDEQQWGLDFNVGIDVASSNIGGDGYVFNKLAAGAGAATALGVPNFSVASTDFELLVRALEVQGKLEVLSRPQVTVNNNEPALIQVGENVSIVTGVNQFQDRSSVVTEREDVGIIMNVTPSISPDGFVRLEIAPSISSVSARTTQISEDFEAPIITERKVETTVTVKDGQTVVIGGLIQTVGEERVWKLPFFGDIPLVGNLFKSTERSNVKTELLVVLRPVVIPGDGPAAIEAQGRLLNNAFEQLADPQKIRETLGESGRFLDAMPLPVLPVAPDTPEDVSGSRRIEIEPPTLEPERMERRGDGS